MRWVLVVALVGCRYTSPATGGGDPGPIDAPEIDSDPSTCAWNYQPANLPDVCALTFGGGLVLSGTVTYDTDQPMFMGRSTMLLPQSAGPMIRVVPLNTFDVAAGTTLEVGGSAALLFVVDGGVTINGALDTSAAVGRSGNGADQTAFCGNGFGETGNQLGISGGSGGGGGALGDAGGQGGNTSNTFILDVAGGNAGTASSEITVVPLRGGCRGGAGGSVPAGGVGGIAGRGGGAIQISARLAVTVTAGGSVRAGGGPGQGGNDPFAGGGGGGSGGGIRIEGKSVTIEGAVCANGGSGGTGSGGSSNPGNPGNLATCSATVGALGGVDNNGGNGGDGGFRVVPSGLPGAGSADNDGGGGGGGGVGRIVLRGTVATPGTVTPAPIIEP